MLKIHCVKVCSSKELDVSVTSKDNVFTRVKIFKSLVSDDNNAELDESLQQQVEDSPAICDIECLNITVRDWVLVHYGADNFPSDTTKIIDTDYKVNAMHKSGTFFWNWPEQQDKIFYSRSNIVKKLDQPDVASTRGQFSFKNL